MGLFSAIFGGKDKSAQKAQIAANEQNKQLFSGLSTQAQDQSRSLYGAADANRNISFQQILDLLGGVIPQQLSAQQQGNVGAQQQLINGLPMFQDAIMGRPVNMAALQPTRINYDTSFARQQLPQFRTSEQALARPPQPDLSTLLAGVTSYE